VRKEQTLEYTGQSSEEILALVGTHADYSLLSALEWGIRAKSRALGSEEKLSDEERLILAVLALDREVNNGGYKQFFWNSSRRFVPTILQSLHKIDCARTAALTESAIAALRLPCLKFDALTEAIQRHDDDRDSRLDACDKEFYSFHETTPKLLRFVVENRAKIQVPPTNDYPRRPANREPSGADAVFRALMLKSMVAKGKWNPSFEEARETAQALATERNIAATELDLESAATLIAFQRAVHWNDLQTAEALASRAFELMRDNAFHIIEHRKWVEALVAAGRAADADGACLEYLDWISSGALPADSVLKKAGYWADLLASRRDELPRSAQVLSEHFPSIDLDNLPAPRLIRPAKELYARMKPPEVSTD
jgi:hypothetical protein